MRGNFSRFIFFVPFLGLLMLQGCITAGMRGKSAGTRGMSTHLDGTGKEALPGYSSELQKVADLIMGDKDLKDSIQNFTPMAHAATTDYMGGNKPITSPRGSGRNINFNQKEVLDLGMHNMCTSGTRVNPSLASVFNNSDKEGRVTWYGLLEACLGIQESGVHWDEGTSKWRMRDSAASGANRRKVVGGFFQIDTDARKNPAIMDACIHQWNEEGHGYYIQDSKFQPRNGFSLDAISTNEKESLKGQEFNIRCGTLMISMQALYQKNSGQCLNPFASRLNHFGPLQRAGEAREIQGCMKGLMLGHTQLRGITLVDIKQELHNLAYYQRNGGSQKGLIDKLNMQREKVLVDTKTHGAPSPLFRSKNVGV